MLSHTYKIVIDRGVGAPGHSKNFVYGFSTDGKRCLTMLMTTVKLPGAATNNSQMIIHTAIGNTDISIERVFKNIFQTQNVHMD